MRRRTPRAEGAPDRITTYFRRSWLTLLIVTVTGIIYNVGLLAGPWFEGRLAQCLADILGGRAVMAAMLLPAAGFIVSTAIVQGMRALKRFYVRRFANDISRSMKGTLYANLVRMPREALQQEGSGSLMTKAVSDADACAEGMRKFTTEIFDTGVALISYLALLIGYDARLALISFAFTPLAYLTAGRMRRAVHARTTESRESAARLNGATLDRVSGALTYRVFGCEKQRGEDYEKHLADYERRAVRQNLIIAVMPKVYLLISMLGVAPILYMGARNVLGIGWVQWDIAAFTTFMSCFIKLGTKCGRSAKLFNNVQTAQVSWRRIKPLLKQTEPIAPAELEPPQTLEVRGLRVPRTDGAYVLEDVGFDARPGEIIGITGPVGCGKSVLGRAFLCERDYIGSIRLGGTELRDRTPERLCGAVAYMGHQPELMSDSIRQNVLLGSEGDAAPYLAAVCLTDEVALMEQGEETPVGAGGVRLSGGQQARLALARTLCHRRPVIVLDDPFSALDLATEAEIFGNLRALAGDSIILLISHRLELFPETDGVIWLENGRGVRSTHEALLRENAQYCGLYEAQRGGSV